MNTLLRTLLLGLLAAPLALMGCEREVEVERESDGVEVEREYGLDDDVERELEEAGEAIREAGRDAAETIDENVDVGDNTGTPER